MSTNYQLMEMSCSLASPILWPKQRRHRRPHQHKTFFDQANLTFENTFDGNGAC